MSVNLLNNEWKSHRITTVDSNKLPEKEVEILVDRRISISSAQCLAYSVVDVEPVLQDGPTCGLAALCMAAKPISGIHLELKNIFDVAVKSGITIRGEMFSAEALCTLAKDMLSNDCVMKDNGLEDIPSVTSHLMNGGVILIPYDADANHEPCLRKGHKAHWALIVGFVLKLERSSMDNTFYANQYVADSNTFRITSSDANNLRSNNLSAEDIRLLARQSKSRHLALWSYSSLLRSNNNLIELSPSRIKDDHIYVLPPGGLEAGLCHKSIFLPKNVS
ncbi:C19orf54 (predicted) [Pycnogonum litorale]